MSPELDKESFEGSTRTLGIALQRHLLSYQLAKRAEAKLITEADIEKYNSSGLLSLEEMEFCGTSKMWLPMPNPDPVFGLKYSDTDLFNLRIDNELKKGKRVYMLTGVYDVFHFGYLQQIVFANFVAHLNEVEDVSEAIAFAGANLSLTSNDHWKFIHQSLIESKYHGGKALSEGVVAARIEPDEYVSQFKSRKVIFPWNYRLGWFDQLPVDHISVFPTSSGASKSWEFGNELLTGWPDNVDIENQLVFVLPFLPEGVNNTEHETLERRETQIREFGFGVVRLPSQIMDTSSSQIIGNFSLKPVVNF